MIVAIIFRMAGINAVSFTHAAVRLSKHESGGLFGFFVVAALLSAFVTAVFFSVST